MKNKKSNYILQQNSLNTTGFKDLSSTFKVSSGLPKEWEDLEQKKDNRDFHVDMSLLLPSKLHWNFDEAYQFVVDNVISRLP
jgi:hypothetical protein